MIIVPPRHSIKIRNPVLMRDDSPVIDEYGNTVLRWGEEEIRIEPVKKYKNQHINNL